MIKNIFFNIMIENVVPRDYVIRQLPSIHILFRLTNQFEIRLTFVVMMIHPSTHLIVVNGHTF